MKTDTLTTIYNHNLWANLSLFEVCAGLTEEQLNTTVQGTFGTIIDTLKHIALAEQGYFSRISTGERYQRPQDAPELTVETMRESIRYTGKGFIEWSHKVAAEDFVTVDWEGKPTDVPKTIIMNQVINHATEHRAQIMVALTQLGIDPPELDAWTYFDANLKS